VVGLEHLEDVGRVDLEPLGDLRDGRRALELDGQLGDCFLHFRHPVMEAAGNADGPDPVAEMALQLAEDRRRGEGGEGGAPVGVEAVDRVDETEARDLQEVVEGLARPAVAKGEVFREGQVAADQLLADRRVTIFDEARPERSLACQPLAGAGTRLVGVGHLVAHSRKGIGGDTYPTSLP